jgi:hypothetical protein
MCYCGCSTANIRRSNTAGFGAGTWLAHCTVTLAGQVIEGRVLSKTMIIWLQVAEFPHASTA